MQAINTWIACPKFNLPRSLEARHVENNVWSHVVFNSGVPTFGRRVKIYTYSSYFLKHDVVRNCFKNLPCFCLGTSFLTSTLLKFRYFILSANGISTKNACGAYYFHMFCIRALAPVRLIVCFMTSTHNFWCFSISQMICILIFLTCDWSWFVCCSGTCPRLANSWAISISGLSCFLVETTVFWLLKGDLRGRFSTSLFGKKITSTMKLVNICWWVLLPGSPSWPVSLPYMK